MELGKQLEKIKNHVDTMLEIDIANRTREEKWVMGRLCFYILADKYTRATQGRIGSWVNRTRCTVTIALGKSHQLKKNYLFILEGFDPATIGVNDSIFTEKSILLEENSRLRTELAKQRIAVSTTETTLTILNRINDLEESVRNNTVDRINAIINMAKSERHYAQNHYKL